MVTAGEIIRDEIRQADYSKDYYPNSHDLRDYESVCNFLHQVVMYSWGGGGGHSNLGCRDTFLKIVSLLENYTSEWGKSIHFWNALCTGFSKIPKSLP